MDPLSGKALQKVGSKDAEGDAYKPGGRAQNRVLSAAAPRLSVIERKKMKNAFNMALATKQQEEDKTGSTQKDLEKQLENESQAMKVS